MASLIDPLSGEWKKHLIPTVIYVVNDETELKFGITNSDGSVRLKIHAANGYQNIALVRINQPTLLVVNIESIIREELSKSGYKATYGREYYPIEAIDQVIAIIHREIARWDIEHTPQINVNMDVEQIRRLQKLSVDFSIIESASVSLSDTLKLLLDLYESSYGKIE